MQLIACNKTFVNDCWAMRYVKLVRVDGSWSSSSSSSHFSANFAFLVPPPPFSVYSYYYHCVYNIIIIVPTNQLYPLTGFPAIFLPPSFHPAYPVTTAPRTWASLCVWAGTINVRWIRALDNNNIDTEQQKQQPFPLLHNSRLGSHLIGPMIPSQFSMNLSAHTHLLREYNLKHFTCWSGIDRQTKEEDSQTGVFKVGWWAPTSIKYVVARIFGWWVWKRRVQSWLLNFASSRGRTYDREKKW